MINDHKTTYKMLKTLVNKICILCNAFFKKHKYYHTYHW